MIDKGLYRTNFSVGGRDGPGSEDSGGKSGNNGGGPSGRDRGMGMAGKTGDYSSGPTGNTGGNDFTQYTKDVINPNIDFVGNTVFGPTQKYSGDGFLSGYRNINPITGQPKMGLAYLGDRIKAFASRVNPFSVIGGLVAGPFGSILGQGFSKLGALKNYDTLADYAKGEFNMFQDEDEDIETQDIRDIYNRSGLTPNVTPTGITNINLGMLPMQRDLVKTGRLQEFQNVPSANPQDYDFLSNAMAEVTQKDINASKAKGFNKMNYNTAIDLGMISPNVTEYEFEQLKQGNITSPGSYQA
jgi:hypothetical protein